MSRKVGQIIARGERRWLIRVYLGRDRETRKRTYHNRTIYGSLRQAQGYLTRKLHERDLSRGVEGLQVTVDEFLDHWLKTAVKAKVRGKTTVTTQPCCVDTSVQQSVQESWPRSRLLKSRPRIRS
jgi:hypothetical protein